jgi:hypothetical protein
MSIGKKTKVIIDLLEDAVLSSRVFNNIKKVSDCCNINLNSWYAIVYIMGIDLDECTEQSDYITDDYHCVFSNYLYAENSNRDAAVLIYNQFQTMITSHLKEYPYLIAS